MTAPAEGEALQRLIEKWRHDAATTAYDRAKAMYQCATELEAALAPLAGPVDASGEPQMMNSRVVMEQFLDGEQFYELMQAYRHTPSHEQQAVLAAFELVKSEIILAALAAAAVPSPPAQEIEHFWTAVRRGWDIEPRAYFEARAVAMGFKSPVEMAVHWMWKRHGKDWPAAAAPSECTCRTAGCGHGASLHGVNGLCSVCGKECWM